MTHVDTAQLHRLVQAMRLIDCGTRMRLTHLGNTIVSRQAKALREAGLIREAPESWIAYEPTSAGRKFLADHAHLPVGIGVSR